MTQLPIIKGRFFGAKKKNIINWIKENPGIEKRLVVEEFKKHTKKTIRRVALSTHSGSQVNGFN